MASPISGAPINPIADTSTTSYINADLTIKNPDTLSLYSFLQMVDTSKTTHKHTVFNGQEVEALINREYFLAVYQDINFLQEKYRETVNFSQNLSSIYADYNNRVDDLNNEIDAYNIAKDVLNSRITTMNNAINTINSISSPTPAQIATYNAAVASYNSYLTSTGNPALLSYKTSADTIYNIPTNNDNTVVIPGLNNLINELNIGIPPVPLLSPAAAPVGANPPLSAQGNYSGGTIPLINPSSYSNLGHLSNVPPAQSEADIITIYFLPFAQNFLANLAATSKKLSGNDDYRSFVNFILKQGFNLNPAVLNAFINQIQKPSLPSNSAAAGGSLGNLVVGIDSPNLERILSTALFSLLARNESISIPPHIYDQINVFAIALLSTIGASAGLSVVKLLGDTIKSLKPDSSAIQIALAAAILQNILQVVADSKVLKDGVLNIVKEIPGLTDAQQADLANKLVTSISTTLLLNAGLSTALSLRSPNLVQDLVTTASAQITDSNDATSNTGIYADNGFSPRSLNDLLKTDSNDATSNTGIYADNGFSPRSLNDLLKNESNNLITKRELSKRLENLVANQKPDDVASRVIEKTTAALPQNVTQAGFQQALALNLKNEGLTKERSQSIALEITTSINLAAEPLATRQLLDSAALALQIETSIREVIKDDVTKSLPQAVIETIIKNLTDLNNPKSFVSLLATNLQTLVATNDIKVETELNQLLRAYMSKEIDSFVVAENIRSPANNVLLSFMTGLMYDRAIPTNWQRPLSIQV